MKILESPHRPLVLFHFKEQKSLKPQIVPHPQISNAFMKFSTERQQIQGREKEIPERCCRCREVKARSNGYCRDLRTTIIMPLFFSLLSAPLSLSLSKIWLRCNFIQPRSNIRRQLHYFLFHPPFLYRTPKFLTTEKLVVSHYIYSGAHNNFLKKIWY